MSLKKRFLENSKNIMGFSTKRRIVVIESDDWGSVRTKNKSSYDAMLRLGLNVDESSYTRNDTLESSEDLELLFSILKNHTDSTGRYPVMTPMYIMANPDFDKIKSNNFTKYYFEPFTKTCEKYGDSHKVPELIHEGINNRLFVPALHGREHLNAPIWMRLLNQNEGARILFENESIGCIKFKNIAMINYLEAFHVERPEDVDDINQSLVDSVNLFRDIFGYQPEHFIEPNTFGRVDFEKVLADNGIKYLLRGKLTKYSKFYNQKAKPKVHWLGKQNKYNQIYLTRNCTFEPHRPLDLDDVVEACLYDISLAFKWKKPALVISHRASYVGRLSKENRSNGLEQLDKLLKSIVTRWPEVEFMTSMELGEVIRNKKKSLV